MLSVPLRFKNNLFNHRDAEYTDVRSEGVIHFLKFLSILIGQMAAMCNWIGVAPQPIAFPRADGFFLGQPNKLLSAIIIKRSQTLEFCRKTFRTNHPRLGECNFGLLTYNQIF